MFYSKRVFVPLPLLADLLFASTIFAQSSSSSFTATTRKPADRVKFVSVGDKLIINVFTVDGIGSATIKHTGGKWPRKMIVRFNLKNLEHVQFSDGETTVEGHLGGVQWKQTPQQHETLKATIRRTGSFIDAEVPAVLLQESSKEIIIEWINEYR